MIGGDHGPFSTTRGQVGRQVISSARPVMGIREHLMPAEISIDSQIRMHLAGKRPKVQLGKALRMCTTGLRRGGHPVESEVRMLIGRVSSQGNGGKLS
jgi:hypothetical protein